ncbi:MAG: copper resistance system multicopper oxidase [Methylococcales bacterium]
MNNQYEFSKTGRKPLTLYTISSNYRKTVACLLILSIILIQQSAIASDYFLDIAKQPVNLIGKPQTAILVNGQLPGPTLRWQEGEWVNLHVTNHLDEQSSIHWHGMILPYQMDGVPGISFAGIKPGETFIYRFQVNQSGTYWYHGHSGLQEQMGLFGALIIDPADDSKPEKIDYVVLLSDWPEADPERTMARLKKQSDYYNFQKRTVVDFFKDIQSDGLITTLDDRLDWGRMRMEPTDLADVTGATYHFLINGQTVDQNWTALFKPDEKVRLRFINGSAMTHFDIRIPGLIMRVVESDGVTIEPVNVDQFRIAVAETYDVIVEPKTNRAYTIFAEAMDRSGYARATLTPDKSLQAVAPKMSPRTLLTMKDMGEMHGHTKHQANSKPMDHGQHTNHQETTAPMHNHMAITDDSNHFDQTSSDQNDIKITDVAHYPTMDYQNLRAAKPASPKGTPDQEITLRLTGNMNRYSWSFNDVKYSDAEPIRVHYGEHIRFKYINETMMNHPIHLHGLWQYLDIGQGVLNPKKHIINVKPGRTVEVDVIADAVGEWAFHCHLLYHMDTGMFRKLIVEPATVS